MTKPSSLLSLLTWRYKVKVEEVLNKSCFFEVRKIYLQSTLVILNSLISNNLLSRSENLAPVLTQRSTNRQQNIVEKRRSNFSSFPQYFQYISDLGVKLKISSVKGGCLIVFLSSASLIC